MRMMCGDLNVEFMTGVHDLGRLYRWADIVTCTSVAEGFYFVGLEAMAAGAVLVSFDIPALRELTQNGRCGRLVPPGNVPELAAAMNLKDEELRRFSLLGRERASFYSTGRFQASVRDTLLAEDWILCEGEV